jgi:hypothetical protein
MTADDRVQAPADGASRETQRELRSRLARPALVFFWIAATCTCLALAAGCGSTEGPSAGTSTSARRALERYVVEIEPLRLAVNELLETADPTLEAYRRHTLSGEQAGARISDLEHRFAAYTVDVAAVRPEGRALSELHAEYSHTYVLEDAYLAALASGLASHDLANLPNTQAAQRAAIIAWRTGLSVLARPLGYRLPEDLQQAGRGEIAPSVAG